MKGDKKKKQAPAAPPAEVRRASRKWGLYAAGLALLLFFLLELYGPALHGPFLFDDRAFAFFRPDFGPDQPFLAWLRAGGTRPMLLASFWLNFQISGTETYSYHAFNVLLHFLNGLLIALAAWKVLELAGEVNSRRTLLSGFAGLLFLVHPVQTESVAYVSSRSEVLSLFFFLAAFVIFLWRAGAIGWGVSAAVLVLGGLAAATKEHAVTLPALLLLTDYFFRPGFSLDGIRRNWRLYIPMLAGGVATAVLILRLLTSADTAGFGMRDLTWYQYFFTQGRAIWTYLRLYVLPAGLNIDPEFPISRTAFEHGGVLWWAALLGIATAAWIHRRKYPLACYGLLVFLILLAPTSSVAPIRDPVAERRMYLPFFGLLMITLEFARRWRTSAMTFAAAAGVLLLVFSVATYRRATVWSSPVTLWEDTVRKSPSKARPRFQLAYALYESGRCGPAVDEFERTSKLQPMNYELAIDWGLALECAGNSTGALEKFQLAASLEKRAHPYALIGMSHGRRKDAGAALEALRQAESIEPGYDMTYVYRGNVFEMLTEEPDKALAEYQRALSLNPNNTVAQDAVKRLRK
ncbi:MAG: hypothetical protein K2X35_17880 [Bryobacteraceae bacterium]|nr:hypothetical protein [Bryobacteraceae bacterium]